MKKTGFFTKLHEKDVLRLIEPSEEIKAAYLKKSESHLMSAKILLDYDRLEESVSTTYYSMYYMTLALFFRAGIKCENHSATIILLTKIFNIDNSEISMAKRERVNKQYFVDFFLTKEEVSRKYYLACQTYPRSDLVVEVPEESRLGRAKVTVS